MWQPNDQWPQEWLKTAGEPSIAEMAVIAEWDPVERAAVLDLRATIAHHGGWSAESLFIRALVQAPEGTWLTTGPSRWVVQIPPASPGTPCLVHLRRHIQEVTFSSHNTLKWYGLLVLLEDGRGRILDVTDGHVAIPDPGLCAGGPVS